MAVVRLSWRYRRLLCGVAAAGAFVLLLAAASRLGMTIDLAGLPEEMVRATAHAVFYGGVGVLAGYALGGRWVIGFVIAALLGAAEEFYQLYVPGRYGTVADWMTDVIGAAVLVTLAAIGQAVWRRVRRAWRRRRAVARAA
jgi:VanZ family protein